MSNFRRASNYWNCLITICCTLFLCGASKADTIKDTLDQAKREYAASTEAAQRDLIIAFDEQIKVSSQAGNLDSVEQLNTQRKAFVLSQTVPTDSAMRTALSNYQKVNDTATASLKAAYESALSDYTKAGNFDDAETVKSEIAKRFPPDGAAAKKPSATTTASNDPILDALEKAKQEFLATVSAAHANVLAVIDAKANEASAKGDLDGYKALSDLSEHVKADIVVPDDVKDTAIRGANAKFIRISEAAYRKLVVSYQTAISDYTKAHRFEEAEAIKAELQDGGWFTSFTGQSARIDLLKAVDLSRDTLRVGWRFNNGVLEPTAWDNEHGPALRIRVSEKGSYRLDFQFTLQQATPGDGSFYLHLPVGDRWVMLEVVSAWQGLNIGSRQIRGEVNLPLGPINEGSIRVSLLTGHRCRVELSMNGKQSLSWEGANDSLTFKPDEPLTSLEDNSNFAVYTKTGTVIRMYLYAGSDDNESVTP